MSANLQPSHQLRTLRLRGAHGGPTYRYRGAIIGSSRGGTVFTFRMKEFPNGGWVGARKLNVVLRLIDLWRDIDDVDDRPAVRTSWTKRTSAR